MRLVKILYNKGQIVGEMGWQNVTYREYALWPVLKLLSAILLFVQVPSVL